MRQDTTDSTLMLVMSAGRILIFIAGRGLAMSVMFATERTRFALLRLLVSDVTALVGTTAVTYLTMMHQFSDQHHAHGRDR